MIINGNHGDLSGTVSVPSSKSFSQRCILYAGFSGTRARIGPLSFSNDENIAINILRDCGINLVISGRYVDMWGDFQCPGMINVGESGTSYRIVVGLLAAKSCRTEITGDISLAMRPIKPLVESLERCGTKFEFKPDGFPVVDSTGTDLKDCIVDGSVSSQYVTSILMATSLVNDLSEVRIIGKNASPDYLRITEVTLALFGVTAGRHGDYYTVKREKKRDNLQIEIEGDYSSGAIMLVLGVLGSEAGLNITGLGRKSVQGDSIVVDLLKKAGADIEWKSDENGDYLVCRKSSLARISVYADLYPDLAVALSLAGIFSQGGVDIINPERLRVKESDRLEALITMAKKYGSVVELEDGILRISPGKNIKRQDITVESKDHRIIMAEACAIALSGSTGFIKFYHEVSKSFPSFFGELEKISVSITP